MWKIVVPDENRFLHRLCSAVLLVPFDWCETASPAGGRRGAGDGTGAGAPCSG